MAILGAACTRGPNVPKAPQIIRAAAQGEVDAVRRLVEADNSVLFSTDDYGNTAAVLGVLESHPEVVRLLVTKGYPIDPTPELPFGLLLACTSRYSSESTEVLEWLLDKGANPNIEYAAEGWTPLLMAVNNGMPDKVRLLVKHGAKINQQNNKGETARELISSRINMYKDPSFNLPHGEFSDPRARSKAIANSESMLTLLDELGAAR